MIKKEEPPFDFKVQVFLDRKVEDQNQKPNREVSLKIMNKLESFGARNISERFLKERSDKPGRSDKIRFDFTINSTDEALTCYNFFTDRHSRIQEAKYKSHDKGKAVDDGLDL